MVHLHASFFFFPQDGPRKNIDLGLEALQRQKFLLSLSLVSNHLIVNESHLLTSERETYRVRWKRRLLCLLFIGILYCILAGLIRCKHRYIH